MTIKGTVIRVGSVGLICTSMAFECSSCHSVQAVIQPQGIFTGNFFLMPLTIRLGWHLNAILDCSSIQVSEGSSIRKDLLQRKLLGMDYYGYITFLLAPNICQSCHGGVKFEPLQSSPFTNTTDWQVAKIQEIQSQVRFSNREYLRASSQYRARNRSRCTARLFHRLTNFDIFRAIDLFER